jgi:acetylornithine deacetylase/succinyl-diaminopimelate desuccinylase-like protein
MGYPEEITEPLLSADGFESLCESLPLGMARQFHACTHLTIAPTVVQGGDKINTIPHTVELDVDVRTLPGQTIEEARAALVEALGELASSVEIITLQAIESTSSPIDTPLWDSLSRVTQQWYPGSQTVPYLTVGSTDAKYFRGKGVTSYGFGLFSRKMTFEDYGSMFHGDNERVDVESLSLSTALWAQVARDLLG